MINVYNGTKNKLNLKYLSWYLSFSQQKKISHVIVYFKVWIPDNQLLQWQDFEWDETSDSSTNKGIKLRDLV